MSSPDQSLRRSGIFPESRLPDVSELIEKAKSLSKSWSVGHSDFLSANCCDCEADFKRKTMATGRIMQHAQIGYRDKPKSRRAFSEIYEQCLQQGVTVDRYGICLDWSMGFPGEVRAKQMKGTGLILDGPEDYIALSNSAPVASHYGDFVLGFPAALENTCFALNAGATSIGNLGQYFTFRLPGWHDDVQTTEATLTALALMASQPVDILVHSNLDDGFAAVFEDLSCALGAVLVEQYIVEELVGAKISHCYGHHYSTPIVRYAFQKALEKISNQPGTMVYGNTVAYQGTHAQNYASLAGYLQVDICAQKNNPSGHAVNPVPVSENQRIPDIGEIIDAQLFAQRLIQQTDTYQSIVDEQEVDLLVEKLLSGAAKFKRNLLHGFELAGIDTANPFEMLLAIRRIGGKTLEKRYGPGTRENQSGKPQPIVISDTIKSIQSAVKANLHYLIDFGSDRLRDSHLKVIVATTDVHEHGKMLIEGIFSGLGIEVIDGGVSSDPDSLVVLAESTNADALALSTYNGVALSYYGQLRDELEERGVCIPVFIGGRLNEIPDESENSLPRDVTSELEEQGAIVCRNISDAMPGLIKLAQMNN